MKLPPLENLRIFEAVARLRGFTAAADSLALSHSAVSRRISELEARLGVQLLQRTSRQVTLTPSGKILFETAQDALKRIHDATAEIVRPRQQPALLISCERSLAMRWLIPRLSGFQDNYPDIPVYLSSGGGAIDLNHANIDLAIRRADFRIDPRSISIPLFAEYIGAVAAPDSGQRTGRKNELTRLHTTGRAEAWQTWMQHMQAQNKKSGMPSQSAGRDARASRDQYFDHFFLSLQAAEAGLGSAIAPLFMVIDSLMSGRLIAPSGFVADGTQYIAILRKPLEPGSAEMQFMQWLHQTVADTLKQAQSYLPDTS